MHRVYTTLHCTGSEAGDPRRPQRGEDVFVQAAARTGLCGGVRAHGGDTGGRRRCLCEGEEMLVREV